MGIKGTRKFITKEVAQDANAYLGRKGEVWFQEGTQTIRFGDDVTTGGIPLSGGNALTGLITFDGIQIIGAGTGSGDGNGYATMELVPDATLYSNDQYIIVDPTAPSHIHLRAGGTQDASSATLILGGEQNNVQVSDTQGVRLQNVREVEDTGFYNNGEAYTNASWFTSSGVNYLRFDTTDNTMENQFWDLTSNRDQNRIYVYDDMDNTYELTLGDSLGSGGNTYTAQVMEAPVVGLGNIIQIVFSIYRTRTNFASVENGDFRVEVDDDIRMYASDVFRLYNYSTTEPIEITTDDDNNSWTWSFGADSKLTMPGQEDGTPVVDFFGEITDNHVIRLSADWTLNIEARANGANEGHLNLIAGQHTRVDINGVGSNIELTASNGTHSSSWIFHTVITGEGAAPPHLAFPDSTRQFTAWSGGRVVNEPDASTGAEGDLQGDLAFSSTHVYYCTADYTDGLTNIWKRISWSAETW